MCIYRSLASEMWTKWGLNTESCFQEDVFSGFQGTETWDSWFPQYQCPVPDFCLAFCNHYIKMSGAKSKFWISVLRKWEFDTFLVSKVLNRWSVWCWISLSAASCKGPMQLGQLWGGVHKDAVKCYCCTWTSSSSCLKQIVSRWSLAGAQITWVQVGQM